jgi:hypothetical protein
VELLERRTVSRKTPGDGRLEVSRAAAERLRAAGDALVVALDGRCAAGRVESMQCTCGKSAGAHEHHFVSSEILTGLRAAEEVEVLLEPPEAELPPRVRISVRRVQ